MTKKRNLFKMILAAMFLGLAFVLPSLTGNIPEIGKQLCPMHLPVLLCGFFCGPVYGFIVGAVAPILKSLCTGTPVFFPGAVGMAFELATYGLVSGLLYKLLPKKIPFIYVSLIGAMLMGRLVWGTVRVIIAGLTSTEFGWSAFIGGAVLTAIPGIIVQIVLVPVLVIALRRFMNNTNQ